MALALVVVLAAGALLVSGGSGADPRTPAALPGEPPPFLGTAVVGSGGLTAAIDAYGDVVDLRAPGPAGPALIDNPAARQAAGTVPADTGIVPWVRIGGGQPVPLWHAHSVSQRFLPGTNVVTTVAEFGSARILVKEAAIGETLAMTVRAWPLGRRAVAPAVRRDLDPDARCLQTGDNPLGLTCGVDSALRRRKAQGAIQAAVRADRRWLRRAKPLAASAPPWADSMYRRSLLVLRALTDRRTGAVAAGARDGWAYAWPRDAAAAVLALAAAGYRAEARGGARFLLGLDLEAAARFRGDGTAVPGRGPQGDEAGWAAAAARAAGLAPPPRLPWRNLPDYQEGEPGDYLANAIADGTKVPLYGGKSSRRLVRRLSDPGSGMDSAAAWAVEPFGLRPLYPAVRVTMLRLARRGGRFGILPSEDWSGGRDPWSAPTAWTAWSLAGLARQAAGSPQAATDRREALHLLADLRRAATPAGALPERVDFRTGVPASTTPLAWSHAFAILALRQLWPG